MSGSSSKTEDVRRTGFLTSDINAFLKAGQTQAGGTTKLSAPSKKERVVGQRTTTVRPGVAGSSLGRKAEEEEVITSNPFLDITDDQFAALVATFQKRGKEITDLRRQPGRRQTALVR